MTQDKRISTQPHAAIFPMEHNLPSHHFTPTFSLISDPDIKWRRPTLLYGVLRCNQQNRLMMHLGKRWLEDPVDKFLHTLTPVKTPAGYLHTPDTSQHTCTLLTLVRIPAGYLHTPDSGQNSKCRDKSPEHCAPDNIEREPRCRSPSLPEGPISTQVG